MLPVQELPPSDQLGDYVHFAGCDVHIKELYAVGVVHLRVRGGVV